MSCNLLEKKSAQETIQEALNALGKKRFALIIHGSSFPSESSYDIGFGTMNSDAGKALVDFASGIFNAIQLGPAGKTKWCDASPYTGTIFSGNPLFIDLKQLTEDKWSNILSKETFDEVIENNPRQNVCKTAYKYIYNAHQGALKEAFINFEATQLGELKEEFEKFKRENSYWLEKDALYEALSIEHDNDYWPMWKSDMDKNLMNPQSYEQRAEFGKRIDEIEKKYADEIEFYSFCQFILYLQNEEAREYALSKGLKMIADRQVAFSDRDSWAYQSLFLDGWKMGVPPDYFSKDGQAWGFPVMDPEKLFKDDGSLDEGGELLKNLYKKMFKENPGGVRIDHIVGLIDPWVYKEGKKPKVEEGAGRLFSSPEHKELYKYSIVGMEDLDEHYHADNEKRVKTLNNRQIDRYAQVIEKIVVKAAEEEGLDKDDIVCEDLGTVTNPVDAVLKKYNLLGMRLTQFVDPETEEHPYRCKNIEKRSWAMVGTHDNEPAEMWAESMINTHEGYLHAKNLVEDLFSEKEDEQDDIIVRLTQDATFLRQIKLVELFANESENIQIFFTDYFGIKNVYNRPGTSGQKNWSLRLPNNFKEVYDENLKNEKALNLPWTLEMAIKSRGEAFEKKHKKLIKKLQELQK